MNFMLIRRLCIYLLIFGLILLFFDDCLVLLAQMGIDKSPST